jgi:hypothetical protein
MSQVANSLGRAYNTQMKAQAQAFNQNMAQTRENRLTQNQAFNQARNLRTDQRLEQAQEFNQELRTREDERAEIAQRSLLGQRAFNRRVSALGAVPKYISVYDPTTNMNIQQPNPLYTKTLGGILQDAGINYQDYQILSGTQPAGQPATPTTLAAPQQQEQQGEVQQQTEVQQQPEAQPAGITDVLKGIQSGQLTDEQANQQLQQFAPETLAQYGDAINAAFQTGSYVASGNQASTAVTQQLQQDVNEAKAVTSPISARDKEIYTLAKTFGGRTPEGQYAQYGYYNPTTGKKASSTSATGLDTTGLIKLPTPEYIAGMKPQEGVQFVTNVATNDKLPAGLRKEYVSEYVERNPFALVDPQFSKQLLNSYIQLNGTLDKKLINKAQASVRKANVDDSTKAIYNAQLDNIYAAYTGKTN